MAQKTLESPDTPQSQRKTKLAAVIKRINGNLGTAFLAWVQTGIDLEIVERDKLYTEHGHDSFRDFVEKEYDGIFDYKQARYRIAIAIRYQATLANKPEETLVPLPSSADQLKPLVSYNPDEAAKIWWDGATLQYKSQGRVTGTWLDKYRRGAIDIDAIEVTSKATNGDSSGDVEEPTDLDFTDEAPVVAPVVQTRTLAATETLDKIEALAKAGVLPDNSRSAIENDLIRVPLGDLEKWNECDEERFKKIGRLIFNAALTYEKAVRVISKTMDESTTLLDFVYLSIANGGKGSVSFRGYTVSAVPSGKEE